MKKAKVVLVLALGLAVIAAVAHFRSAAAQESALSESRLAVVWSCGDPEVAHRVCLRFQEAIDAFNHFLELDLKNVRAEDNVGLSYAGLLQTDEAISAFRTAIAWQARSKIKDPGRFLDLGSFLLDQNRVEEAVPYLLQAVEISPQDPGAHGELGKAYIRLKRLAKAQTEMEGAVQLAPRSALFHYVVGQIYQKEGLKDKAKLEIDRSAALTAPDSAGRSTMH